MVKRYSYHKIEKNWEKLRGKKVVIWCKSISALRAYKIFYNLGIEVIGFTDSFINESGTVFAGLPVYTFEEIKKMEEIAIYIATEQRRYEYEILEKTEELENAEIYASGVVFGAGQYDLKHMKSVVEEADDKIQAVRQKLHDETSKEIFDKLLQYRLSNDTSLIESVYETSHSQYFPTDGIIEPEPDEVFVDAGAHNGFTSFQFSEWTEGKYSKIYMMEPDPLMFEIMKEYVQLRKLKNVVPVNCGAWSSTCELRFKEDAATGSSKIVESGKTLINAISIDEMLHGERASFIKMDIEGAEMPALIGAEKTIQKYKPKLAISIYHKEDDLWEIPYYILTKYPYYKMYIRHYDYTTNETVMYATL